MSYWMCCNTTHWTQVRSSISQIYFDIGYISNVILIVSEVLICVFVRPHYRSVVSTFTVQHIVQIFPASILTQGWPNFYVPNAMSNIRYIKWIFYRNRDRTFDFDALFRVFQIEYSTEVIIWVSILIFFDMSSSQQEWFCFNLNMLQCLSNIDPELFSKIRRFG